MKTDAIKAFVAAQKTMGAALKTANNPAFRSKYADLESVRNACFPALHENGFAVMQPNGHDDHGEYVETMFLHESGEAFSTRVYLKLSKSDMQGYGSAITYARRYGLMALAGIAPEDDDGNAAAKYAPKPEPKAEPKTDDTPTGNGGQSGLADAWVDAIKDSLPPQPPKDAPKVAKDVWAKQFADAVAKQLEADFQKMKSLNGLRGQWAKRQEIIGWIEGRFPDTWRDLVDVYETCERGFTGEVSDFPGDRVRA